MMESVARFEQVDSNSIEMKNVFNDNNFDTSKGRFMPSSPAETLFDANSSLSSVSTTSAFLLGFHNFRALDSVYLPDFVKEHQTTLTFPEKVRKL